MSPVNRNAKVTEQLSVPTCSDTADLGYRLYTVCNVHSNGNWAYCKQDTATPHVNHHVMTVDGRARVAC